MLSLSPRSIIVVLLLSGLLFSCKKGPDRALVISQVQEASQLATVEYVLNKLVLGSKEKKRFGFSLSSAEFLAETEARVKAGIDLSKIKQDDVHIEDGRITLHLPPVEVLNFSYPSENFKILPNYLVTPKGNKLSMEDVENFYRLGELAIRRDMHFLDIEKSAQYRTKIMLKSLLKAAGFTEVYFEFEPMEYGPAATYNDAWNDIKDIISANNRNE